MVKRYNKAVFLTLSLILLVVLGLALLCVPKGELHLALCNRHTPARDIFYRYYTQVAEWLPYVICIAVLLFGRIGNGLFATCCMIGSALTTQLFKHLINAPRPITWFSEHMPDVQLPLVEGVDVHAWFSFPSGHTTSFFALALVLSILLSQRGNGHRKHPLNKPIYQISLQTLLFLLAALGAYSRIYLNQHFALDVFAGIVVGLSITLLFYAIFKRYEGQKWYNFRLFSKK